MPKISVILPIYQVEEYIENSILTICNQTFQDFEVIIIDDGSKDNSIIICEKVFSLYPEVCYKVFHQENQGVAAARNKGIELAMGEWVLCIDPDDTIHPRMIEYLFQAAIKTDAVIAFCDFKYVSAVNNIDLKNDTSIQVNIIEKKQLAHEFLTRDLKIIVPTLLVKKSFIITNCLVFPIDCSYSEDQFFIWKAISVLSRVTYVNNQLYNYLLRLNSTMSSSTAPKVLTGYLAFKSIEQDLIRENVDIGIDCRLILPRWVLGALHSATKVLGYQMFVCLAKEMDYKKHMKNLIYFPDKRVVVLSTLARISLPFYYWLLKGK